MPIVHPTKWETRRIGPELRVGLETLSSVIKTENDPECFREEENNMCLVEETGTEVNISLKNHPFTAESTTVTHKCLGDCDNRKTANEVDQDLDQKSTIKCEEENLNTANEVDQDLDQKLTIKCEEENFINSQYLISHEEVDIKSEDDVEQSHTQESAIEKKGYRQSNKRVAAHSAEPNKIVEQCKCNNCSCGTPCLKTTVRQKPKDEMKMHKCPDCPFQSKYKSSIKQHSDRHRNPDEIVWHRCTECPYKTNRKENLKRHAVVVHNENRRFEIFKCAHCDYETPRKKYLRQHIRIHHGKKGPPIYCPEPDCPYTTRWKGNLKIHSLMHSDQFFKCTQCPYQSKRQACLKQHQLKHESTDKWLACPQCPFKTIRKSSLNTHVVNVHTHPDQLEWYMCFQCPFKTIRKLNLIEHVRVHANPDQLEWYRCEECPYKTNRKYGLKQHAFTHNRNHDQWLHCTYCSYKTLHKYRLRRHQMEHQGNDDGPGRHKTNNQIK